MGKTMVYQKDSPYFTDYKYFLPFLHLPNGCFNYFQSIFNNGCGFYFMKLFAD